MSQKQKDNSGPCIWILLITSCDCFTNYSDCVGQKWLTDGGTVKRCRRSRHGNTWWSLMCRSMCERGANDYFQSHIDPAYSQLPLTVRVSSQFPWPPPPSPARSDWQRQSNIWSTREEILHLRQLLGVNFILAERERERQRMKESLWRQRRQKEKNLETRECASLLFVRCCFINVEGRVLVLSVSRDECSADFKHSFCLFVCWACVASAGLARTRDACSGASRDTRVTCREEVCKG